MLVMTVKEGQYLMVGDEVRIHFLKDLSSGAMSVGIEAPRDLAIARSKVYERELRSDEEKNKEKLEEIKEMKTRIQKSEAGRQRKKEAFEGYRKRAAEREEKRKNG